MLEEIKTIKLHDAWELETPDQEKEIIGNRWVYNAKHDENGNIVRYKARLVTQGFGQIKKDSCADIFSPILNIHMIRLFIAILAGYCK